MTPQVDVSDFEVNVDDFEVTPSWQRPRREGLVGAGINRVIRGGKAVAEAIYPAAPAPPKPWGQALKDTAVGVGGGLLEAASAITAPIGEAVRPLGEAFGRRAVLSPEQLEAAIAEAEANKARLAADPTVMNTSPQVIEQLDTYLTHLKSQRDKSLEQKAYETGGDVAMSAEMLGGAMFGKPFKFRGAMPAETAGTAFVPRSIRREFMEPATPLPTAKQPIVDMEAIGKPEPPAPAPRQVRPYEEPPQQIRPPEPRPIEPAQVDDFVVTERAAARIAPERPPILGQEPTLPSAAEVRPTAVQEPSGLLDAQGRPVQRMPEPGQGTARAKVSPDVPEEALPAPEAPRLRTAGEIADERTGGAVPPKPELRPARDLDEFQRQVETGAESDIERVLRQGTTEVPETPTTRLMRKGKGISGGSGSAEDVGWITPEGKEVSHLGKAAEASKAAGRPYEMTHVEALQEMGLGDDMTKAFASGMVRYVRAGNQLNVETGAPGIDNAIKYISSNGRNARGGVIIEITDPTGGMLESKMFDRPWQAIEYLKSKQTPVNVAKDAAMNQQARELLKQLGDEPTLDNLTYAQAELKGRKIRPAKPISGGAGPRYSVEVDFAYGGSRVVGQADTEAEAMRMAAGYSSDAKDVRVTTPEGQVHSIRGPLGARDSGTILKQLERRGIDDSLQGYQSILSTITSTNQAKRIIKGDQQLLQQLVNQARSGETRSMRRPPQISGGSDLSVDQPLPTAREVGLRRKPQEPAKQPVEVSPEAPSVPATAGAPEAPRTPLRKEFGSEQKTAFTPDKVVDALKKDLPEEVQSLVGSKRTPPGVAARWKSRLRKKLPQEAFVQREAPNSPVITDMAWYHAETAERVHELLKRPFMAQIKKLDPEAIKQFEKSAVDAFQAGATLDDSIKNWPQPLKDYIKYRNDTLLEENVSRQRLGLKPLEELPGPYLPHMADAELNTVIDMATGQRGQTLQTTVKGAQEHRKARTMLDGQEAGIEYADPRNAILVREWNSIRMTQTERLMTAMKDRSVFLTEQGAKAASKTGEAFPVSGLPGAEMYWTGSKAEALFLAQNIAQRPAGLQFPGIGSLKTYSDLLFRNPNLVNPSPHITKNMWAKYILASGDFNPGRIVADGIELFRKPDLDTVKLFREHMPYSGAGEDFISTVKGMVKLGPEAGDPAYAQFQHALIKGPVEAAAQKGLDFLAAVNKPSSTVIFKWGDPAMRYSLFKKYIKQGMQPQEAANHAWVDLVNYGTRSDLVDFWKAIPMNFFVPWRVGSVTSVAKQIVTHPVRAALVIGGIDLIREARYRETGRWTHLPWDYFEGPIVTAIESGLKGDITALGYEGMSNALFGPAGEMTAGNIRRMMEEPKGGKEFFNAMGKVFWGIVQLLPTSEILTEFGKFQKDGNPSHFINAAMAALVAERQTKGFKTHSVTSFIPESVMPFDYKVKYERLTNPANAE